MDLIRNTVLGNVSGGKDAKKAAWDDCKKAISKKVCVLKKYVKKFNVI
jgi:hypothetical protein